MNDTPARIRAHSHDGARKRAIAQAVRTEIHWLFPRDRRATVIVDGDDIAVELGPPRRSSSPPHTDRRSP